MPIDHAVGAARIAPVVQKRDAALTLPAVKIPAQVFLRAFRRVHHRVV